MLDFTNANHMIKQLEDKYTCFDKEEFHGELLCGVDLGTAYIVLVALDKDMKPVACEMEFAQVVRDGLLVDFAGARSILKRLKEKAEEKAWSRID